MENEKISLQEQFMRIGGFFRRRYGHGHHSAKNPYQGQGRILRLLQMQPEISQKELSFLLDMRPQSLGELLAKLEHSGYIVRSASEADKRVMNIKLSEKGFEAASNIEAPGGADAVFGCLSEEEQTKLGEYLDRVISHIEEQYKDDEHSHEHHHHHHGRGRRGHRHYHRGFYGNEGL